VVVLPAKLNALGELRQLALRLGLNATANLDQVALDLGLSAPGNQAKWLSIAA
jgi:hypothetical protein